MNTRKLAVVAVLCLAGTGAALPLFAQGVSLGEVLQKGAVKLSAQELRAIAAGAQVTSIAASGTTSNWENESGGKLAATSDKAGGARAAGKKGGGLAQGSGTWQVDDSGRYCVEITWGPRGRSVEQWCRFVFRAGGKLYASNSDSRPDANAFEIEFRK